MKRIAAFEPWFFLFFGLFHLHRIWALVDRSAYADFWMGVMVEKGAFYCILMSLLTILCLMGIGIFIKNRRQNFWWRWIYLLGGGYLLFDLFAIATGLNFWQAVLRSMFDTTAPYWNMLWVGFVLLGAVTFILGLVLLKKRNKQEK